MKKAIIRSSGISANGFYPKIVIKPNEARIVTTGSVDLQEDELFFIEPPDDKFGTDYILMTASHPRYGVFVVRYSTTGVSLTLYDTTTGSKLDYNFTFGGELPILDDEEDGINIYLHNSVGSMFEIEYNPFTYYTGVIDTEDAYVVYSYPVAAFDKETGEVLWHLADWYGNGEEDLDADRVIVNKDKIWTLTDGYLVNLITDIRTGEFELLELEDSYDEMIALPDGSVLLLPYYDPGGKVARISWDGNDFQVDTSYGLGSDMSVDWGMDVLCNVKHAPDGSKIYLSDYEKIVAYDAEDGSLLWVYDYDGNYRGSETIAINPLNGNILTHIEHPDSFDDMILQEIDHETGTVARELEIFDVITMDTAAVSPNGILVFIEDDTPGDIVFVDLEAWDYTLVPGEAGSATTDYMVLPLVTKDAAYFIGIDEKTIVVIDFENKSVRYLDVTGLVDLYAQGLIAADEDGLLLFISELGIIKITDKELDSPKWLKLGVARELPDDLPTGYYAPWDVEWQPPVQFSRVDYIVPQFHAADETDPVYGITSVTSSTYEVYQIVDGVEELVTAPINFGGTLHFALCKWQSPTKFVAARTNSTSVAPYLVDVTAETATALPTLTSVGATTRLFGHEVPGGDYVMLRQRSNVYSLLVYRLEPEGASFSTETSYEFPSSDGSTSLEVGFGYDEAEDKFYASGNYQYYSNAENSTIYLKFLVSYDPTTDTWAEIYVEPGEDWLDRMPLTQAVINGYAYHFNTGQRIDLATGDVETVPGYDAFKAPFMSPDSGVYLGHDGRVAFTLPFWMNSNHVRSAYVL